MKKIVLVFVILCAGVLNGMEVKGSEELNPALWGYLPEDLKTLIIITLSQSGDNLVSAINNIKKASMINKELYLMINKAHGSLKGFTALVQMLAHKFNTNTLQIANLFNTATADAYNNLGQALLSAVGSGDINKVTQLIEQEDADVNYSPTMTTFHNWDNDGQEVKTYSITNPLTYALAFKRIEMIQLLLKFGAKPGSPSQENDIKQLLGEERKK